MNLDTHATDLSWHRRRRASPCMRHQHLSRCAYPTAPRRVHHQDVRNLGRIRIIAPLGRQELLCTAWPGVSVLWSCLPCAPGQTLLRLVCRVEGNLRAWCWHGQRQDAPRHPQKTRMAAWPYSSVKQMAARLKEGDMNATFLAHCGRKRQMSKQDKETLEKGVTEVPETSVKQVQHWFLAAPNCSKRREHISLWVAHKVGHLNCCVGGKRRIWALNASVRVVPAVLRAWYGNQGPLCEWCVWGQIKRQLVRTESFAHLRTQMLLVVADLKAQDNLDPRTRKATS